MSEGWEKFKEDQLPLNWNPPHPSVRESKKVSTQLSSFPSEPKSHRELNGKKAQNNDGHLGRTLTPEILSELQHEVADLEVARGTADESLLQKSLILSEETFEVLKLLRPRVGVATARVPKWLLDDELVDLLFVSAAIANRISARLDTLWFSSCTDDSLASSTDRTPERLLSTIVEMSQQALRVIGICGEVTNARNTAQESELAKELSQLLHLVARIASISDVDLRQAVDGKLMKDQLRLWST